MGFLKMIFKRVNTETKLKSRELEVDMLKDMVYNMNVYILDNSYTEYYEGSIHDMDDTEELEGLINNIIRMHFKGLNYGEFKVAYIKYFNMSVKYCILKKPNMCREYEKHVIPLKDVVNNMLMEYIVK